MDARAPPTDDVAPAGLADARARGAAHGDAGAPGAAGRRAVRRHADRDARDARAVAGLLLRKGVDPDAVRDAEHHAAVHDEAVRAPDGHAALVRHRDEVVLGLDDANAHVLEAHVVGADDGDGGAVELGERRHAVVHRRQALRPSDAGDGEAVVEREHEAVEAIDEQAEAVADGRRAVRRWPHEHVVERGVGGAVGQPQPDALEGGDGAGRGRVEDAVAREDGAAELGVRPLHAHADGVAGGLAAEVEPDPGVRQRRAVAAQDDARAAEAGHAQALDGAAGALGPNPVVAAAAAVDAHPGLAVLGGRAQADARAQRRQRALDLDRRVDGEADRDGLAGVLGERVRHLDGRAQRALVARGRAVRVADALGLALARVALVRGHVDHDPARPEPRHPAAHRAVGVEAAPDDHGAVVAQTRRLRELPAGEVARVHARRGEVGRHRLQAATLGPHDGRFGSTVVVVRPADDQGAVGGGAERTEAPPKPVARHELDGEPVCPKPSALTAIERPAPDGDAAVGRDREGDGPLSVAEQRNGAVLPAREVGVARYVGAPNLDGAVVGAGDAEEAVYEEVWLVGVVLERLPGAGLEALDGVADRAVRPGLGVQDPADAVVGDEGVVVAGPQPAHVAVDARAVGTGRAAEDGELVRRLGQRELVAHRTPRRGDVDDPGAERWKEVGVEQDGAHVERPGAVPAVARRDLEGEVPRAADGHDAEAVGGELARIGVVGGVEADQRVRNHLVALRHPVDVGDDARALGPQHAGHLGAVGRHVLGGRVGEERELLRHLDGRERLRPGRDGQEEREGGERAEHETEV